MKKFNVKETFLKLTSQTYPHGTEHLLFDILPQNLIMDDFGNLFIQIGESDVMFTSHLDTATSVKTDVNHVFDGDLIKTDGKTILGADDKAGVTIMLYMIQNKIPGLYYFFLGEEVGCVGSKKVSGIHKTEPLSNIKKVISFDRRGTDSIITFQASSRCCSDTFGKALADQLNLNESTFKYRTDPTGLYTDSAQFTSIYPECTNISVGYYSEHTFMERQDIEHLTKLAEACLKVDWKSLPVERDPSKIEYSDYYDDWYGYGYGVGYGSGRYNTGRYNTGKSYAGSTKPSVIVPDEKVFFYDKQYEFLSSYKINKSTGIFSDVDIHASRIKDETDLIIDLFSQIELEYSSILWDGLRLTVFHENGETVNSNRNEMIEYFPQFDLTKIPEFEFDEKRKLYINDEYCGDM